jgi:hypothetical protein
MQYFCASWKGGRFSKIFLATLLGSTLGVAGAKPRSRTTPAFAEAASRSNDLTNLSSEMPYTLHANIVMEPHSGQEKRGEITIYRAPELSRIEIRFADFHQTKLILGDKQYLFYTGVPQPGLDVLDDLKSIVHVRDWFPAKTKFKEKSGQKFQGGPADCLYASVTEAIKTKACFNQASGAVVQVSDSKDVQWSFPEYQTVGSGLFPRTARLKRFNGAKHLELQEITITQRALTAEDLSIPQGAVALDSCSHLPGARWDTREWEAQQENPDVILYATVEADGTALDLQAYGRSKWAENNVLKKARKWEFVPAHCNGRTISTMVSLPLAQPPKEYLEPSQQRNCDPYCSTQEPRPF